MKRRVQVGELVRQSLHPPFRERRFWIVQLLVIAIALAHEVADADNFLVPIGIPAFATVALFLVPIVYAALNFGLAGSLASALWVTLLTLPDFVFIDKAEHHWNDGLQLVIVDAVALFVGQRVEIERIARRHAEDAGAAYRRAVEHVVRAQEEERWRISQELHDEPLQSLIQMRRWLGDRQIVDQGDLPALLSTTIGQLRDIAQGLRPPALDDLGVVSALRRTADDFAERNALEVDFRVEGDPRRLNPELELTVFRIAQEALRNVERHAAARCVAVRVVFNVDEVGIAVEDDGVGFVPVAGESNGHLGLLSMRERAQLFGGTLTVRSQPDAGTHIWAALPTSQPVTHLIEAFSASDRITG